MESAGVVRTLAEPNLTAISGEVRDLYRRRRISHPGRRDPANRPRLASSDNASRLSYKKFGISLNFTPVVLSEGPDQPAGDDRSLGSVDRKRHDRRCQDGNLTIPSIKTRRAETTLEIPSGGSMAMAGLIQEQTKQAVNGLPGLDQLPVLGALFRSQDFVNNQTELMVLVTPYVVRAVAQKELSRPDDGFAPASDSQSALLARINRIYGLAAPRRSDRRLPGQFWLHH